MGSPDSDRRRREENLPPVRSGPFPSLGMALSGWRGGGGRGLSPDSTGGAQGSHPRAPQVTRTLGVQNGHLGQSGPLHDSTDSRGQRLPAPSRSPQLCVQPPPPWGGTRKSMVLILGGTSHKKDFFFSKKDEVGLVLHAHVR